MGDAKFKLEDILNKQKAPPQILDLMNLNIQTEEEFKAIIEKIPDYKIRPEKPEDIAQQIEGLSKSIREYKLMRRKEQEVDKLKDSDFDQQENNFAQDIQSTLAVDKEMNNDGNLFPDELKKPVGKKNIPETPYQFADPCPTSMKNVRISDLSSVDINWKMLTLARPKTKTDEEIFSRLVQLDKWRLQTRAKEQEQDLARGGKNPFIVVKQPSASKGGVTETSIKVCSECAEEFCSGTCKEFQYDSYQRIIIPEKEAEAGNSGSKKNRKKKKSSKSSSSKKKNARSRPTTLKPTKLS